MVKIQSLRRVYGLVVHLCFGTHPGADVLCDQKDPELVDGDFAMFQPFNVSASDYARGREQEGLDRFWDWETKSDGTLVQWQNPDPRGSSTEC